MCGRFTQLSADLAGLEFELDEADEQFGSGCARYNGAPSQDFWIIRRHPETGCNVGNRLVWGLIPHWSKEPDGGRKPINARSETVARLPSFRAAFAKRRCILPINNFFEWRKTTPPKQPFAIGMTDGAPFGLAAIWENWRQPETGEYLRTFCILTCPANDLITTIHDRMPVILPSDVYERWLSSVEPNPNELFTSYPSTDMRMWPISTRVNSPRNDDPGILDALQC